MENIVYLQLKRKYQDIYYFKTAEDYEVDFYIPRENLLIQVVQNFDSPEIQRREIRSLVATKKELNKVEKFVIVTESSKQTLKIDDLIIQIVPLYEWLLQEE